jgi:lysine-ketoglutarate reductase/saccharopine dehydrogenase-like protein (TIGR00300 family)
MEKRLFRCEGHLIDSGLLSKVLNTILEAGSDYHITDFVIGKTPDQTSSVEIAVMSKDSHSLKELTVRLGKLGAYEEEVPPAIFKAADRDKHAPEDFYSTTNHRSEVFTEGTWHKVLDQRMDAVIVRAADGLLRCTKLRNIKAGDMILCNGESVRVFPPQASRRKSNGFAFMDNAVSSERSGETAIRGVADMMSTIRHDHGRIIVVCGPVVVHTGGADALASLIRKGYVQGFLGGNAVAVHDLEYRFFGTSLGIDLKTGKQTEHGHDHHMKAINRIYGYGSIRNAIASGALKEGLMFEVLTNGIPYCLAGSIRDDGPLPETVNDMIEAQRQYASIIKDADMILMLSTMLHSIGTGNMTPSHVHTICVDINPAVVTKLSDRGTGQAVGIVSDVGLFLRELDASLRPLPGSAAAAAETAAGEATAAASDTTT